VDEMDGKLITPTQVFIGELAMAFKGDDYIKRKTCIFD
jgi:hypothetical protein